MPDLVSKRHFDTLFENLLEFHNDRRLFDSSSDERRYYSFNQEQFAKYRDAFYLNRGILSDGTFTTLPQNVMYFMFPCNITITRMLQNDQLFIFSHEAARTIQVNLQVWVNGIKIPDHEILFHPTKSNVDVLVPLRYMPSQINDGETLEIVVEKRVYRSRVYTRSYFPRANNKTLVVPITKEQRASNTINVKTVVIYMNKELYTKYRKITLENESFLIDFDIDIVGKEFEIFVDSALVFVQFYKKIPFEKKCVWEVPETYIDSFHGPLSKFSCFFFIDDKRILDTRVKQKGRLHFEFDEILKTPNHYASMYIVDRGFIDDTLLKLYGSDYFLYNMIGTTAITRRFVEGESKTIFDTPFFQDPSDPTKKLPLDFDETLNDFGKLYSKARLDSLVENANSFKSFKEKIITLLKGRSASLRMFLEMFGREKNEYVVEYNGVDKEVFIGTDVFNKNKDCHYDIVVNNKHVATTSIGSYHSEFSDYFGIPSKYFTYGKNIVTIDVHRDTPYEYLLVNPDDFFEENGQWKYRTDFFKAMQLITDIEVLTQNQGKKLKYVTNDKLGYSIARTAQVSYDETDKKLTVLFPEKPTEKVLILNKRFSKVIKFFKGYDKTLFDIDYPIYFGSNTFIPFIPQGRVIVYAGEDRLLPDIDYYFKTPKNDTDIAGTFLVIKRNVISGTDINIYITSIETESILNKKGFVYNNPYGLVYLGNLKYPFSLKYLDVYANNQRLTDKDVDILSDKLIRIHSLYVPLYDLSVESSFSVNTAYLKPYIDTYEMSNFEKLIEYLFRGAWLNRPAVPNETLPDFTKIYESFVEDVDSVKKRPNPTAISDNWNYPENPKPNNGINDDGSLIGTDTNPDNKSVDIRSSQVVGDYFVGMGTYGRTFSGKDHIVYHNYKSGKFCCNTGEIFRNETITASAMYNKLLIVGTEKGHVGFYDIANNKWYGFNDSDSKRKLNFVDDSIYPSKEIRSMIVVKDLLIIAGLGGNVASYDFYADIWYPYNDIVHENCCSVEHIIDDIHALYALDNSIVLAFGTNGQTVSCDIGNNGWTRSDGGRFVQSKKGPDYYETGVHRDNKTIYSVVKYNNLLLLSGESGYITYFNTDKRVYSAPNSNEKIVNRGDCVGNVDIYCSKVLTNNVIVFGAAKGRISSFNGDIQLWRNYNTFLIGFDIYNSGILMKYNDVYTIQQYKNFIVFAGKNGRLISYRMDFHQPPKRFDAYKTMFLKWYTTPGTNVVHTRHDISDEEAFQFTIYKDTNDPNWDISIRPGDIDIIDDISMNDLGRYPKEFTKRRKFIADFIAKLPPGSYSADEIWKKYLAAPESRMLYPEDVMTLRSGDPIDSDTDIRLT